jgi:hypothetical protein
MSDEITYQVDSPREIAIRTNLLGHYVLKIARLLFVILTILVAAGLFAVYRANTVEGYYGNETNWEMVWVSWSAIIGAWILYGCGLAIVSVIGAMAQTQAQMLWIQITQSKGD